MFCTKCGAEVSDGVRFCKHCGAKLRVVNEAENGDTGSFGMKFGNDSFHVDQGKEKKSSPKVRKILLVCGILAVAGLLVFFLFRYLGSKDKAFLGVWAVEGGSSAVYFKEDGVMYRGNLEEGFQILHEDKYHVDGKKAVTDDESRYYVLSGDGKELTYYEKGMKEDTYVFYAESMETREDNDDSDDADSEESYGDEEDSDEDSYEEESTDDEDMDEQEDEEDTEEEEQTDYDDMELSEEEAIDYIRTVYGNTDEAVENGEYTILEENEGIKEYWDDDILRLAIIRPNAAQEFRTGDITVNYYYDDDGRLVFAWGYRYVDGKRREYRTYFGVNGKLYKYLEYRYKKAESPDTRKVIERNYENGIEPESGSREAMIYEKGSSYVEK